VVSLRARILIGFVLVIGAGFYYLVDWILDDLRRHYLEAVEETLVDTATILSSLLASRIEEGTIPVEDFRAGLAGAARRRFQAKIYDVVKTSVDVRVYVTDEKGIVLFDSDGGRDEGKDYSRWNDVYRTLQGRYGARATRRDSDDPSTSVLYIASPLLVKDQRVGVLTVGKPTDTIHLFLWAARRKIAIAGTIAAGAVLILGIALTLWFTRPIRTLTRYAQAIRDGERAPLPRLGRNEIGTMGRALEEMRVALERKDEIEQYVQGLTHEVKGPLSAIRGAAELLGEEMPAERRAKFLDNIRAEAGRIQRVVDRLLQLSALEARQGLRDAAEFDLAAAASEAADRVAPALEARRVALVRRLAGPVPVRGERDLVLEAAGNLLQNAVDFTPPGGTVTVAVELTGAFATLTVSDTGPGVPDYALGKVFEKFFSLQRPETGRKSSGLGLTVVRQVALLHGGEARLENRPEGGAVATLTLPAAARP
jgi:two-component system sensor histidine kinase CreC